MYDNGADVRPVDRSQEAPIRVPLNRLRECPEEIPNQSWPSKGVQSTSTSPLADDMTTSTPVSQPQVTVATPIAPTVWEGRLRKQRAK